MSFSLRLPALAVLACFGSLACAGEESPAEPLAPPAADQSLSPILFPDKWVVGMDMPTPARYSLTAATVNGVIYLIGGHAMPPGSQVFKQGLLYRPDINNSVAWRRMAPLPFPRAATNGAVAINGKIYVTGGMDSSGVLTNSLFIYDPATNTWGSGAQMPEASVAGVSGAINGKLYVLITPVQDVKPSFSRLYRFDPVTQSWTIRAASQYNHFAGTGGVIGGKFYVVGGGDDGTIRRELEVYDPATNTWTYNGLIPTGRRGAVSAVLNGKLYVAGGGGKKGETVPNKVEMYDPSTNLWTTKRSMPTKRVAAGATVWNGRFYVFGGLGGDGRENEYYVPVAP
jgi:N-acetylneuraminic acid mutarotase